MKILNQLRFSIFRYKYLLIISFSIFGTQEGLFGQQKEENQILANDEDFKSFIVKSSINEINDSLSKIKPEKFLDYNLLFLDRGKTTKNDTIKYLSYYYISQFYHYKLSKFSIASSYADSALIAAKKIGTTSKILRALNLKGNSEFELGNYEKTFELYSRALKLSKKSKLIAEEVYSLSHIGHIHKELKNYKKGINIYDEILNLLEKEDYKKIASYYGVYFNAINVLAICHRELGNTKKSIKLCKDGILKIDELKGKNLIEQKVLLLSNLGKSYIINNDYDIALNYLHEAETIFLSQNKSSNHNYFYVQFHIAEALKGKYKNEEALLILDKIIEEAKVEKKIYSEIFLDIISLAIDLTERINSESKGLKYNRLKNRIIDSIHKENIKTRILVNENLSEKNDELHLNNETISEKLLKTKFLVSILLFSLLIIIFIYIYNNSKNRKKFQQLLNKIENFETEKTASNAIVSDENANKILKGLQKLENKKFFLRKDCSLHSTAVKLKTNTSYLSKIINSYKQKTFKDYINELRIKFILNQIKENPRFRLYTIKAIAEETGYKSVNTLNQTFKKQTQLNLSFYIKQINKAS